MRGYWKLFMVRNQLRKVNIQSLWVSILIIFFVFQREFSSLSKVFEYFDEIFCIFVTLNIIIKLLTKSKVFKRNDFRFFFLCAVLILIGLAGNLYSRVLTKTFYIGVDIISTFKVLLAYYYIKTLKLSKQDCDKTIQLLAALTRAIVVIITICYILSVLGLPLNMFEKARYGVPSYRFTFNVAGNYSKFFYFTIPLLSADLFYSGVKRKRKYIILGLLMWLTSLRARAFAFVACYIIFSFWYFKIRGTNKKKLNWANVVPISILAVVIGWNQIVYYLTNDTQARANLLRYALVTAEKFLPIGSGFGTYGSDVAMTNYSRLYSEYGFLNIYGMGKQHTNFLNDNYWPMIIGQFGVIGTVVNIAMIYMIYKECFAITRNNKYFYFATSCMVFFLFASSIVSKSYCEFTSISVLMLHSLLVQREKRYVNIASVEQFCAGG